MSRFFILTVVLSMLVWYLHEYHTVYFIMVTRNIPLISPLMSYIHFYLANSSDKVKSYEERLFTEEDLAKYDGMHESKGLYLAILGKVYDVSKGKKHYAPGGSYSVFTGKDASRSFITGDFSEENVSDDVLDLPLTDLTSLKTWQEFYDKDYSYMGKLVGRYYTKTGEETEYHKRLKDKLNEADSLKRKEVSDNRNFPPCNIEWSAKSGSRVWCSTKSGGIDRDWVGVPRKLYEVGTDRQTCVCIDLQRLNDPESPQHHRRQHLEEYSGCEATAMECFFT